MLKKQIGHMIVVSVKYFFDLDHTFCYGALMVILAALSIAKLFFIDIVTFFHNGLLTVKGDFLTAKQDLILATDRVKKFAEREASRYDASVLKEVFTNNFRNWRLD